MWNWLWDTGIFFLCCRTLISLMSNTGRWCPTAKKKKGNVPRPISHKWSVPQQKISFIYYVHSAIFKLRQAIDVHGKKTIDLVIQVLLFVIYYFVSYCPSFVLIFVLVKIYQMWHLFENLYKKIFTPLYVKWNSCQLQRCR